MAKLGKCEFPAGHGPDDFKAFGPPATRDTDFAGTKLCDMSCFSQEEVDSNKMYFCCVAQSKKNSTWYVYVEYGRVGATKPQYQFTECGSESEAQRAYEVQCGEKNTKRGQWETIAGMKVYRPKPGKDLYLVRTMASRQVQLNDAKTITVTEGVTAAPTKKNTTKKSAYRSDAQTTKLLRDLLGGTVSYTRSTIQGGAIPVQSALDEGRQLLQEAKKRLVKVGDNVDDQVADKDLRSLSAVLYSRIPKIKPLHCAEAAWILSKDNIQLWEYDIDAFESALKSGTVAEIEGDDPMQGMPLDMSYLDPTSEIGKWLYNWAPNATRNKHYGVGTMQVHNIWTVNRHSETAPLLNIQKEFHNALTKKKWNEERPLHQDKKRPDLDADTRKVFWETNTGLMFHGTRSVNTPGILREGLRFPKELVGVHISGAMFGGGVYYADDWKKSAGYTSLSGGYYSAGAGAVKGRHAFMFVTDVVLGNPHVASGPHPYTKYPDGTHCIFGKAGHSSVANNEWIIFNKSQQRLKYLIEFSAK